MRHFVEKCRVCGVVLAQCRCPSTEKMIEWRTCDACMKQGRAESYGPINGRIYAKSSIAYAVVMSPYFKCGERD